MCLLAQNIPLSSLTLMKQVPYKWVLLSITNLPHAIYSLSNFGSSTFEPGSIRMNTEVATGNI